MSKIKQIYLRTSGGMGIPIEGEVEIDALPQDLARRVQSVLAPQRLDRIAKRPRSSIPDQIAYELVLPSEQRPEPRVYAFEESQADDDVLDVLDELTARIVEAKFRARKEARGMAENAPNPSPAGAALVQETLFSIPDAENLEDEGQEGDASL